MDVFLWMFFFNLYSIYTNYVHFNAFELNAYGFAIILFINLNSDYRKRRIFLENHSSFMLIKSIRIYNFLQKHTVVFFFRLEVDGHPLISIFSRGAIHWILPLKTNVRNFNVSSCLRFNASSCLSQLTYEDCFTQPKFAITIQYIALCNHSTSISTLKT